MDASAVLDLAVAGYLVALPIVAFALIDIARIPGHLYRYTTYSRALWVGALLAGYLAFGVGGIIVVVAWLRSTERDELRAEWALDRRWERDAAVIQATAPPQLQLVGAAGSPSPARASAGLPEPESEPAPLRLAEPVAAPEPERVEPEGVPEPSSRRLRRQERKRRHRWAILAVTLPLALAIVGTASRIR